MNILHPSPPANVMIKVGDYHTHNFSIIFSWDEEEEEESGEVVDEYRILTNTTDHFISTNTTTVVLEGEYNIPHSQPSTVQALVQRSLSN